MAPVVLMVFSVLAVLQTPVFATFRTRLRMSKRIEDATASTIPRPLQSMFDISSDALSNHEFNATAHHTVLPQPFHDILDVPPEERHLPDGMTIYDILEMPTMTEANRRRIAFSRVMPSHIPNISEENIIQVTEEERFLKVIKRQESTYLRACAARSNWVQVSEGITVENEFVEVSRGQYFFQTTCLNSGGVCYGYPTPPTGTDDVFSRCTTLKSWVIAWARVRGDTEFGWRHIALATCCACAVKGRPGDNLAQSPAGSET